MKNKTKRGGARAGAGRPSIRKSLRVVKIGIVLPPETVVRLDSLVRVYRAGRSAIIRRLIDGACRDGKEIK